MKSGMSSFQMIVLAVFGTFAVAGVLIFSFVVGTSTGTTTGPVVLWGTFDETAVAAVLREMVETDGRLRQVTYVQKDPDTYVKDLTDALASGTGPDLFILRQDDAVSQASKIQPIPYGQLAADTFHNYWADAANTFLGADGVLGVPFAVDPFVLFWNRDMLAAAGIARPPQYWEDIYAITRSVTQRDDTGSIQKSAVALGEYENVNHAKQILGMLVMQAGGLVTIRDGAGTLTPVLTAKTGDTSQPADNALRFYTQFANPSSPDYSWNRAMPEARTAFAQGDLALYLGPASEEPLIRRLNPNLNFAVATSVPQVSGASAAQIVDAGYAYAFAVPKASANPTGALTVAYILGGSEGSHLLSLALGLASARRDVLAQPAQGNDAVFNRMALLARTWEDPDSAETDRIFKDMIESVTSGAARSLEALQRADQAMRQITSQ